MTMGGPDGPSHDLFPCVRCRGICTEVQASVLTRIAVCTDVTLCRLTRLYEEMLRDVEAA